MAISGKIDEFVWAQKYRPNTINECILPKGIKDMLNGFLEKGNIPDMIFAGSTGVGKTTVAKAFCNQLGIEYLFLNGSGEDRGIDTVKNKITRFATSISFDSSDKRKIVIYDEADNLTADSQMALRSLIESNSDNCGFILTCNHPGRLHEALRSRCTTIEFKIPKSEKNELAKDVIKRIIEILKNENINEYSVDILKTLVIKYFPDIRRILNNLQSYSSTGKIDEGILEYIRKTDLSELISFLKDKEWTKMRKWVGENVDDPMEIVLNLYRDGHNYFVMSTFPQGIIYLNECQNTHPLASDKELNLVSALTKIMSDCQFL